MKTILTSALLAAILGILPAAAQADAIFKITEAFTGLSGEDGTRDWIEVTNFGDMPGDTGTLIYDDEDPTVASSGVLDSFILAPGESAVFLLESDPADDDTYTTSVEEFIAIWGAGITVGVSSDGGGLGQGGDEANIGVDNGGVFEVIDSLTTPGAISGELSTIEDPSGMGTPALSVFGQNGAFASATFFNDNLGLPNDTAILTGSPGIAIPEPATAMIAAFGAGLLVRSRRRA